MPQPCLHETMDRSLLELQAHDEARLQPVEIQLTVGPLGPF